MSRRRATTTTGFRPTTDGDVDYEPPKTAYSVASRSTPVSPTGRPLPPRPQRTATSVRAPDQSLRLAFYDGAAEQRGEDAARISELERTLAATKQQLMLRDGVVDGYFGPSPGYPMPHYAQHFPQPTQWGPYAFPPSYFPAPQYGYNPPPPPPPEDYYRAEPEAGSAVTVGQKRRSYYDDDGDDDDSDGDSDSDGHSDAVLLQRLREKEREARAHMFRKEVMPDAEAERRAEADAAGFEVARQKTRSRNLHALRKEALAREEVRLQRLRGGGDAADWDRERVRVRDRERDW